MPDPALVEDVLKTKRITSHRTKQIETRIQRQIVIEDGKVISDSGPQVTTKTLEDSVEKVEETEKTKTSSKESCARRDYQSCNDTQKVAPLTQYMFGFEAKEHGTGVRDEKHYKVSRNNQSTHHGDQNIYKLPKYYFGQDQNPNKNMIDLFAQKKTKTNLGNRDINNNDPMYMDEGDVQRDCQFNYEYDNHSKLW